MRRTALLLLVAVAGCRFDIFGPDVRYANRRPMDPVPLEYATWYAATEKCLGMQGDFSRVVWFVADEIHYGDLPGGGAIDFPDEITLRSDALASRTTVRHEAEHHITQTGNGRHLPDGSVRCDGRH